MLSVAQVAFTLNVVVLGIVIAAERQIRRIVFNFATLRLIDTHTVPVLHDDDTSLPFIPSSIIKYRKQPGMFSASLMLKLQTLYQLAFR